MKIDAQKLGHDEWIEDIELKWIRLSHLKTYRYRFDGRVVDERKYLSAYIEQCIIMEALSGTPVSKRFLESYKE